MRGVLATNNGTVLLAEEGGQPVGFLEATGGAFRRNRHVARLVVGVMEAYAGRGIGTALVEEAERWARERGVHRLELTVPAPSPAAVALYEKAGFTVEVTRRCSMLVDGSYVDEHCMSKLLV